MLRDDVPLFTPSTPFFSSTAAITKKIPLQLQPKSLPTTMNIEDLIQEFSTPLHKNEESIEQAWQNELKKWQIIKEFHNRLHEEHSETKDDSKSKSNDEFSSRLLACLGYALVGIGDIGITEIGPFIGFLINMSTGYYIISGLLCLVDGIINYSVISFLLKAIFNAPPNEEELSYIDLIKEEIQLVNHIIGMLTPSPEAEKMANAGNYNNYLKLAAELNNHIIKEITLKPYERAGYREFGKWLLIGIFILLTLANAHVLLMAYCATFNITLNYNAFQMFLLGVGGTLFVAGKLVTRQHTIHEFVHPAEKKVNEVQKMKEEQVVKSEEVSDKLKYWGTLYSRLSDSRGSEYSSTARTDNISVPKVVKP